MNPVRTACYPLLLVLLFIGLMSNSALAATPTISISAPSSTVSKSGPVSFTITYTNATTVTLSPSDITLNSTGTATGTYSVSGTGTATRVVSINSTGGDGTIWISIAPDTARDASGSPAPAGTSPTFIVDNTPPAISIASPSAAYAKTGTSVTFNVSYTDATPITTSLTASNIILSATGTASGIAAVSGTGASRTVTISSLTGDGTLRFSIVAGTATDQAGNTASASGQSAAIVVDNTTPTVSISAPSVASTTTGPVTYTVTYGDTNFKDSSALTGKLTLNKTGTANGTLSVDSSSGNSRTVTISGITGDGSLGISVASSTATDLANNSAPAAGPSSTFQVDSIAPTVTISAPSATYANSGASVTYTVTYADNRALGAITLATNNITLITTGTASGTVASVSGTGNSRIVTINNLSGNGTLAISLAAGTAGDTFGNAAPAAGPSATFVVDNTPPTVTISAPSASYAKTGTSVTYTVTYADDKSFNSSTLNAVNITLNKTGTANGSVAVSGSGATRTVTISGITGDGTLGISLAAGTGTDSAGNSAPTAGPSATFTVDNTLPTVAIGAPSAASTSTGPVTYTITYGDANFNTSSLAAANVTLNKSGTNGTLSVSGTGNSRTVTINGITGDGTMGISLVANTASDLAGNNAPAAGPSATFVVDSVPPTVTISAPSAPYAKSGASVTYTVTYADSHFNASTLAASDILLIATGTAGGTVASVSGTGNSRIVTINNLSGSGTLAISIAAGTASDTFGNPAPAAGPSATFTVDNTPPTIAIGPPSAAYAKNGASIAYTVTYADDKNFGASTLAAANVTLNKTGTANGTVAVSGSGANRIVTISGITGDGTLGISLAAGTGTDSAGNSAPAAGPSATFIADNTVPTVAISAPSAASTTNGPITYTLTYSDAYFGSSTALSAAKVILAKTGTATGTVTVDALTGLTRTVTISAINGDGTLGISLASGTATDLAGNTVAATGTSATFVVDNIPPAIVIGPPSAAYAKSGASVTYTVTYTDTHFNASTLATTDITLNKTGTANGTVASVSGTGNTRTVTINNLSGNGTLGISLAAGTASDTFGNNSAATSPSTTFVVDSIAPTVTIGAPSASYAKNGDSIAYTVTYADDKSFGTSTLSAADVTLVKTGTADGTISVDSSTGNSRKVTVTVTNGDGTLKISLGAGTATDAAGNSTPVAGPSATFIVDNTPPTVAIGAPSSAITTTGPVTYALTYGDANFATSSNALASKISLVATGTAKGTVSVDTGTGTNRTVTIKSISGDGTLALSMATGSATDLAKNNAPAAVSSAFAVDSVPPAISISAPSASSTNAGPITYTVTYSDSHFNASTLSTSDIILNKTGTANGTVAVSGTGNTRTVTISGITGDGTLGISIGAGTANDTLGNISAAAGPSATFLVDNTPASVSIGVPSASYAKSGSSITYTITYADANFTASTLAVSDVILNTTGSATGTVSVDSATGTTRKVTISSLSGDGTLGISIKANTAIDKAGNPAAPSVGPSATFTVDNTPPLMTIGPPSVSGTNNGPVSFTVTYADANFSSSTLAAGYVSLIKAGTANGTVTVSGTGNTRTVTISSITGGGSLAISIAAGTTTDLAGNSAPAGTSGIVFVGPSVVVSPPSATNTSGGPVTYNVIYVIPNFNASSLAASSITLNRTGTANGTVSVDSGVGSTRTVTISSISGNGTLGISIAAGTATDTFGNNAPASGASATFIVDNVPPSASISTPINNAYVSGTTTTLKGNASDSNSIQRVELSADNGVTWSPATGTTSWSLDWALPMDGVYKILARAVDAAGNTQPTPAAINLNVSSTPPDTIITSAPTDPSTIATGIFFFTSTKAGAAFECKLDSIAYVACASPYTTTPLANGRHTMTIRAKDLSGNYDPIPVVYAWTVNSTAKIAMLAGVPSTPTNDNTASITVSGSGIGSYQYQLDAGAWSTEIPVATPINIVGLVDGPHTVSVVGKDSALGTWQAVPTVANWSVDTTPPVTTILSEPATLSASASGLISFKSSKPGTTFQCALDAGNFAACTNPYYYTSLGNGDHTFSVRGTDMSGNIEAAPAGYSWKIDTVSAIALLSGTPPALTNATTVNITVSGKNIDAYQYMLDGGSYSSDIDVAVPITLSSLADGIHTISVVGKDSLGSYQAFPTSISWTIDTVVPATTVTSTPVTPSNNPNGSISFYSTKSGTTFLCQLDWGSFVPCSSPFGYSAIPDGTHTLAVKAVDLAGNMQTLASTVIWTVDTASPTAAITYNPAGPVKEGGTVTITATFNKPLATSPLPQIALSGGNTLSPTTMTKIDASHYSYSHKVDNIGNNTVLVTVSLSSGTDLLGNPVAATPSSGGTFSIFTIAPPTLTLSTLDDGALTNVTTLNISGTASTPNGISSFTINGTNVTVDPVTGAFSQAVTLKSGSNTITSIVTDKSNNQTKDIRVITLDTKVPTVTISAPSDNSTLAADFVTITGTIDDPTATVQVTVNGGTPQSATITGNSFSVAPNLTAGLNTVVISATDQAGNIGSAKRTITSDTTKPTLAITDPAQDITVVKPSLTLSGTVSDTLTTAKVTITMDSKTYTPKVTNGTFQQALTLSTAKQYPITVTATDQAGNSNSVQRNVIYALPTTGDLNCDGKVDVTDALLALQMAVGIITPDAVNVAIGDVAPLVNDKPAPDGKLDIADAVIILDKAVGLKKW